MDEMLNTGTTIDDAIAAYMKSKPGEDTPLAAEDIVDPVETEEVEADAEDDPEEEASDDTSEDETGDDETDEDETPAKRLAEDDDEVEFTLDGKAQRVSVKDLRRLAGQEKAITQRSQALAETRKTVEAQGQAAALILQRQYEKAVERAKPYRDIDLFTASRDLEPSEFSALRKEKEEAEAEVAFLASEATTFLKASRETGEKLLRAQADETLKQINDPESKFHIPNWNDALYNTIRSHAIGQGFDRDTVNKIVDPAALKVLHKAMLYDEQKARSETVKKKLIKAPARTTKKSSGANVTGVSKVALKARQVAASSGTIDDVAAAFEAALKNRT